MRVATKFINLSHQWFSSKELLNMNLSHLQELLRAPINLELAIYVLI